MRLLQRLREMLQSEGPAETPRNAGRMHPGAEPPVFVFEMGTPYAFSTVEEAEREWEACDIPDLFGFDSRGRWLRFYRRSERMDLGIDLQPTLDMHKPLSHQLLIGTLLSEGEDAEWLKRASFEELVQRAYERFSER